MDHEYIAIVRFPWRCEVFRTDDDVYYSAWLVFEPTREASLPTHLDGAIGPRGKSYKFQGDWAFTQPFSTIQVQIKEHPKVNSDTTRRRHHRVSHNT